MIIQTDHIDYTDCGMKFDWWNWFLVADGDCVEYGLGYDTEADALRAAYDWLITQEAQ